MKISDWTKQLIESVTALKVVSSPTYPARNEMPVEQARERVAADFKSFIQAAEEWWSSTIDPFERFAREVLQEGKEPPPPVHAHSSSTGVGKTQIGGKEIAEDRHARTAAGDTGPMAKKFGVYCGPTHRLNDDTAKQFREAGLTAQVYRGRLALDPDVPGNKERVKSEQVLMCLAPDRVREATRLRQPISESCCRKRVNGQIQECEFYKDRCKFQQVLRGPAPDVWLAPHEMLFNDQKALNDAAWIIIDETFYQDGIRVHSEALPLEDIAVLGEGVNDGRLAWLRKELVGLLAAHPLGGLQRERSVLMSKEECTEAISAEWKIFNRLVITPGMTEGEISKLKLIERECLRARRMTSVWGALRDMLDSDIEVSGRLILERIDGKKVLSVRGMKPVVAARKVPVVILDATLPSKSILERIFPQVQIVSDIEAKMPHVHVRQVLGAPVSQSKLWGTEEQPSKKKKSKKGPSKGHHLRAIRRYILRRWLAIDGPRLWQEAVAASPSEPKKPMVVICQKEVQLWLENAPTDHRWYGEVPRPGIALPEGIALEHFNAIEGVDDHKEVRLLMTIGRTTAPPVEVEMIAGALTGAQPLAEGPTGRWYGRVPRAIRMADGTGIEVLNCDQHVDPVAEAVRYQICEAQLIQAIGRGRGVNRTAETPLDIDILADVVLPVTVDEVVQWEERSELVEMLARNAIALIDPGHMAKAWPSVWEKAEAARYALKKLGINVRAGGVPIEQVGISLIDKKEAIFSIGKFPLAIFVYRRAVAGAHFAVALFDPRQLPNPGGWIKEKCGELAERLHFLWQRGEIAPMAGAGKLGVVDRLVRILRKPRYILSADDKQHPTYTGTSRPGRFTFSKDPQAMAAYDGSPGGITTPHVDAYSALPLELRMRALGLLHDTPEKLQ